MDMCNPLKTIESSYRASNILFVTVYNSKKMEGCKNNFLPQHCMNSPGNPDMNDFLLPYRLFPSMGMSLFPDRRKMKPALEGKGFNGR